VVVHCTALHWRRTETCAVGWVGGWRLVGLAFSYRDNRGTRERPMGRRRLVVCLVWIFCGHRRAEGMAGSFLICSVTRRRLVCWFRGRGPSQMQFELSDANLFLYVVVHLTIQ
jgi:hypothetical protein